MTRQPDDIEFLVRRAGDDPFGDKELRSTQGFTSQDIVNAVRDVRNGTYVRGADASIDPKAATYGAKGDTRFFTDAAITAGQAALSSTAAAFTVADVGKIVAVAGAGAAGASLVTTVLGWQSATQITLAAPAVGTVAGAAGQIGTDDTAALSNAFNAALAAGRSVRLPTGVYMSDEIDLATAVPATLTVDGDGMGQTVLLWKPGSNQNKLINAATSTFSPAGSVSMVLADLTIDGNKTHITYRQGSAVQCEGAYFAIDRCEFRNTIKAAIRVNNVSVSAHITRCWMHDFALHDGTSGDDTNAILINRTIATDDGTVWVEDNRIEQTTPPVGAGNSVGGIVVSPDPDKTIKVIIRNNYLKWMGSDTDPLWPSAQNYTGPIQIYRNGDESIIEGNTVLNSYFDPIKVQRSNRVKILNNIVDGEGTIVAASQPNASAGITSSDRAPTVPLRDVQIVGNTICNLPNLKGIFNHHAAGAELLDCTIRDNTIDGCLGGMESSWTVGRYTVAGNVVRKCTSSAAGMGGFRLTSMPVKISLADGAITTATNVLTSASATFTANDIGKPITVNGAGTAGASLVTNIAGFTDAHTVTLTANAATTVAAAAFNYGYSLHLDIDGNTFKDLAAIAVSVDAASTAKTDGAITTGTNTLTSATGVFAATDVGKDIFVAGAGVNGGVLITTILGFTSATTVTLTNNANTTVAAAPYSYGIANGSVHCRNNYFENTPNNCAALRSWLYADYSFNTIVSAPVPTTVCDLRSNAHARAVANRATASSTNNNNNGQEAMYDNPWLASGGLALNSVNLPNAANGLASKSITAGVGYSTGAGGAVTQASSSSTGVTLNRPAGQITTVALTTAAGAEERFTLTNSTIAATDVVAVGTTYNGAGTPAVSAVNTAAGAVDIVITNLHASAALNAVLVVNFAVVKAVAA